MSFAIYVIVGFIAELIDGTLGMAYGVSSTSFLLSIGIPPAQASASVHTSEIFTTLFSGLSHLKFGNVSKALFKRLVIPGVIGGIIGAYILTEVPVKLIKPAVALYLSIMGILILYRAFKKIKERIETRGTVPLGLVGGFFDAIGGGGWGPIVASTLVARGNHARFAIGSVNLAEFFVTVAQSITFFLTIGISHWNIILGLIIGGVIGAPIAAFLTKRLPVKVLMIFVGTLIILLSFRTIYLSF